MCALFEIQRDHTTKDNMNSETRAHRLRVEGEGRKILAPNVFLVLLSSRCSNSWLACTVALIELE